MKTEFQEEDKVHLGYNVQRIREIEGVKQTELGLNCNGWSQQQISKLEQSEFIDDVNLGILAKGLGVTINFIKNFKEEKAIYNIQSNNTFEEGSSNSSQHYRPTITNDAADKLAGLLEKFILEDKAKTEALATLSKAVLDIAEELKNLKNGK